MGATRLIESLLDGGRTPFELVRDMCYGESNRGLRSVTEETKIDRWTQHGKEVFVISKSAGKTQPKYYWTGKGWDKDVSSGSVMKFKSREDAGREAFTKALYKESVRENLQESICQLNEGELALALDGSSEQASQVEELLRALEVAQVPYEWDLVEETGELVLSWPAGFTEAVESALDAMGIEVMEDTETYEAATFSGEPLSNLPSLFKRNKDKPKKKESVEDLINAVMMGEVSKDELLARFGGKQAPPFKDDNNKKNNKSNSKTNEAIVWDDRYR